MMTHLLRVAVALLLLAGVASAQTAQDVAALRKQAQAGDASAQYNLGVMYAKGRGVPQDDVLAYMWWNLAVSRSSGDEQKQSMKWRDDAAARLTPQQRADGQRMAREWQAAFEKRKQ